MNHIESITSYLHSPSNNFRDPVATKRVIFLGMLFVSFLIVANLTAFKIVEFHLPNGFAINFPAALAFFPLTYFFDDVLTEGNYSSLRVMANYYCCLSGFLVICYY